MRCEGPFLDVVEMIEDAGGGTLRSCYQCATCSASCPWNRVTDFRVRELVRLAQLGLDGYEGEALWRCVTCNLCVKRCPRGVEITELVRVLRELVQQGGQVPSAVRAVLASISDNGNPWAGEPSQRRAWSGARELAVYQPGMDFLLFQCCTPAYDPRSAKVGMAMLGVLDRAGIELGVLEEERCCGESTRKLGDSELSDSLREKNSEQIRKSGAKRVVVSSPHCLETLTRDYDLDGVEVVHVLSLLCELLDGGRLALEKPIERRVTYHDPCYLGRQAGLYDEPRRLLGAIPGIDFVEMSENRENSLCCGGGGGGMWAERPVGERFSLLRWDQADRVGAKVMATACPYCLLMLEDGATASSRDDTHLAVDVIELVNESVCG